MSDKTFNLQMITPEGVVFDRLVASVRLPGASGSMGVLANHAAFASPLEVGEMRVRDAEGKEHVFAVGEGFVEIGDNQCRVLTDSREGSREIDLERAERAARRARERLERGDAGTDVARARAALQRALVRLKIGRGGP